MKRTFALLLLCGGLLCGCAPAGPAATPAPTEEPAPTAAPTAAPTPAPTPAPTAGPVQAAAEKYAGVSLAAHVQPEMLVPEFWAQPGDDTLLLTPEEIAAINQNTLTALAPDDRMFDLASYGETIPGGQVRAWLAADPAIEAGSGVNGCAMPAGYLEALAASRAVDAVPETVALRYGVAVQRVNVRIQPTDDFIGPAGESIFDGGQQAELYWDEPLLILHESGDGSWLYILTDRMTGWVPRQAVAEFSGRDAWLNWQQPADYLVVTANRMRLDYNTQEPALSERELSMGMVLPLAGAEAPANAGGRRAYGCYIVRLPLRAGDGSVYAGYAPVAVSADVSRGPLPFTRQNLLTQLFKLQGTNYGWGGMQGANDCSGTTWQLYRCFGLHLPRNSKSLSMLPWNTVELEGLSTAQRQGALDAVPAGSILYFPGHIMLYLGAHEGRYYVMSAVGSYYPEGSADQVRVLSMAINDLSVRRKDGASWLDQLRCAKYLG